MERRKVLLGSGALFTTILAGCVGDGDLGDDDDDEDDYDDGYDNDDDHDDHDDDDDYEDDDDKETGEEIPQFDEDDFELESDVLEIKELTFKDNRLSVRVMLLTTDQDELAEELEELAPAFERAIRDADAEAFFAEVHELEFTLYDEDKTTRFAVFMDILWLQQFVDDEITSDEFVDELLNQMGQFADDEDDMMDDDDLDEDDIDEDDMMDGDDDDVDDEEDVEDNDDDGDIEDVDEIDEDDMMDEDDIDEDDDDNDEDEDNDE